MEKFYAFTWLLNPFVAWIAGWKIQDFSHSCGYRGKIKVKDTHGYFRHIICIEDIQSHLPNADIDHLDRSETMITLVISCRQRACIHSSSSYTNLMFISMVPLCDAIETWQWSRRQYLYLKRWWRNFKGIDYFCFSWLGANWTIIHFIESKDDLVSETR